MKFLMSKGSDIRMVWFVDLADYVAQGWAEVDRCDTAAGQMRFPNHTYMLRDGISGSARWVHHTQTTSHQQQGYRAAYQ